VPRYEVGAKWNHRPCGAVTGTAVVADSGGFPQYWARELVGQRRDVVMVIPDGGPAFYIDDENGWGLHKLLHGGGWQHMHRHLDIVDGSFEPDVRDR
jgi:hypothetical protein